MPTAAQTQANQANAKKSTGPKTAEGKAKVAGNHIIEGLFIRRHLILPGEDAADYDALLADATGENRTALAECEWRIRRCQRAEAAHRRERLRLLAAKHQISAVTSKPIREPQVPPLAVTSKPVAPVPAKRSQSQVVTSNPFPLSHPSTSNPIPVAVTSSPTPATPTPTITYGLPPRYVQELLLLKRSQSTLDPTADQGRLSPSLRIYIKDRNHLAQARELLKSLA